MVESWRSVPGYERWYSVSDHGRVRLEHHVAQFHVGYILSQQRDAAGYQKVGLTSWPGVEYKQHQKGWFVHQLVLLAFVGPCPEGCQPDHINGNRADNRLANLEYVTRSENTRRAWARNGYRPFTRIPQIIRQLILDLSDEGYSYREISEILDWPYGSVRNVIKKGY